MRFLIELVSVVSLVWAGSAWAGENEDGYWYLPLEVSECSYVPETLLIFDPGQKGTSEIRFELIHPGTTQKHVLAQGVNIIGSTLELVGSERHTECPDIVYEPADADADTGSFRVNDKGELLLSTPGQGEVELVFKRATPEQVAKFQSREEGCR